MVAAAHRASGPGRPADGVPGLARYTHLADAIRFRAGQIVFDEGQRTPRGLFWLKSGRVKFSLLTNDGAERVVGYATDGAVFGEESILEGEGRPVMCQALSDGVAYLFEWPVVIEAIRADPDLAINLLEAMARKLQLSVRLVGEMSFLDVKERVVQAIARLALGQAWSPADGCRQPQDEAGPRRLRVTHQELASLVGASRVMVSNALAQLRREGVIEQERRHLVVRDLGLLLHHDRGTRSAGR